MGLNPTKVIIFIIVCYIAFLFFNWLRIKMFALIKKKLQEAKYKRSRNKNERLESDRKLETDRLKTQFEPLAKEEHKKIQREIKKFELQMTGKLIKTLQNKYGLYQKSANFSDKDFNIGVAQLSSLNKEEKQNIALEYIKYFNKNLIEINEKIKLHTKEIQEISRMSNSAIRVYDFNVNLLSEIKIPDRNNFRNDREFNDAYNELLKTITDKPIFNKDFNVVVPFNALAMHSYIVGGTGSGKSELFKLFIYENIKKSNGVFALDPHGDFVSECAKFKYFKGQYKDKLVYISPEFDKYQMIPQFNPLEHNFHNQPDYTRRNLIVNRVGELKNAFEIVFGDEFTKNMSLLLKNCLMVLLEEDETSLLDLLDLMIIEKSEPYLKLAAKHWNEEVRNFFQYQFKKPSWESTRKAVYTRFAEAFTHQSLKFMLTGKKSSYNLTQLLDEGKIVLINASQGLLTQDGAKILGAFLITELTSHALGRARSEAKRTPIFAYIDECQNFLTPSISKILEETRKYGLYLNLAHQHLGQFRGESLIKDSILANTEVKIVGKSSFKDKNILSNAMSFDFKKIESFEQGQFIIKAGEYRRPVSLLTHRNLIAKFNKGYGGNEFDNYMTPSEWEIITKDQITKYYKNISIKGKLNSLKDKINNRFASRGNDQSKFKNRKPENIL